MTNEKKEFKIKITENGPYIVSGNIPLTEKIIVPKGKSYEFKNGRELPQSEEYALCRCGQSKNPPFCDGTHAKIGFVGTETASKDRYEERAELRGGPAVDLLDDHRCASARFCHREMGDAWELTEASDNEENRNEAIQAAKECPSGRITAVIKKREVIEPQLEPAIEIVQDPEKEVSAGIFVKGYIPIESADGEIYEIRNRVALCRCGQSKNKPFCDARHVETKYLDSNCKIVIIVGSLRKDSLNLQLAKAAESYLKNKVNIEILEYSEVPLLNQDYEYPAPEKVKEIRDKIKNADGIWFFTPEYNHFLPGVLKNLIDWLSRPVSPTEGQVLTGKPAAISGISPGMSGTGIAQDHLVTLLSFLNMDIMNLPRLTIPNAKQQLNQDEKLELTTSAPYLKKEADAFIEFIKNRKK